ncbi:CmcI family methyltransferase [Azospirillum agricola]|uniref:CmcI family methyltransferase n=1 Tax=Azospirillum agricola TaxID=1720247 RepID=UPI000A0F0EA0|nr:CmcI family methyltransferase [Azospirillum agricola]SMH41857.1 Cephalosporin hydroxylase [Azospirillum lipoferum]
MNSPSSSATQTSATQQAVAWDQRKKAWALLKGLRPSALDLDRIALVRQMEPERLREPGVLEELMLVLGLNDEGMGELPPHLHPHCGPGLRVWQYPIQFAPYLRHLAELDVRSYLEIGIRHGGSYVLTVELLDRFRPLDWAVGVDIIPCPSMADYTALNPRSHFAGLNSQSPDFAALRDRLAPIDLVFIDSHHEEEQCRREVAALLPVANMIALHDVSNVGCPGVRTVWEEIRAMNGYDCVEFTAQYDGLGPFMGIGLAVRKDRLRTEP